jgi:hypothetical protein
MFSGLLEKGWIVISLSRLEKRRGPLQILLLIMIKLVARVWLGLRGLGRLWRCLEVIALIRGGDLDDLPCCRDW